MKFLVTGATGFIGQYVITELLNRGYDVIATSTSVEKAKLFPWFDQVKYISFDLKSDSYSQDLYDLFYRPDVLIHLAWEGLPNYSAEFHLTQNAPAHFRFLANLIQHGLKNFTVTGTCFEYGMIEGCLTETMVCNPVTAYGQAKLYLLEKIQILQRSEDFKFKWIRLFYMYGKGQNAKSLTSQLDQAIHQDETYFNMSGGEQERDFLPVEIVAKYIVSLACQEHVYGIINCCSGIPLKVLDFIKNYLKKLGKTIKLNIGFYPYAGYEPMSFWGDTQKLMTALG